jgi:hypothetical protein
MCTENVNTRNHRRALNMNWVLAAGGNLARPGATVLDTRESVYQSGARVDLTYSKHAKPVATALRPLPAAVHAHV